MSVFEGLKVLDVASYVAAPAAATILSDFGAEVIKLEPPEVGDGYRAMSALPNLPKSEHNCAWDLVSRNKLAVHAGAFVEADGMGGTQRTVDSAFRIDGVTKVRPRAAPALGQHSRDVLRRSGYSDAEVNALVRQGVVREDQR